MRILFVADVPLENPTSGSEQVLNHQATALAREGMAVSGITRRLGPSGYYIRNTDGVRNAAYSLDLQNRSLSALSIMRYPLKFLRHLSREGPFQAAVCHQPLNCFLLLIMRKLEGVPILYVFHSPSHEEYLLSHEGRKGFISLLHVEVRRMIERFCLKKAMRIMVLSNYMKNKLQDIHGIWPGRIIVNPGGVDLDHFRPPQKREALKEKLGFPKGKIHLVTVRNLEPRMGLDNLLTCIYIFKKNQDRVHLILGGEGTERRKLEGLIRKYGLRDEVTLTGFIPSKALPGYLGAADFFVLPTRDLEGFGLVTPESLACGTPVLGTPVGGTREILSGFDPAFLFRDASPEAMVQGIDKAIARFFMDTREYEKLRDRCREYAEKGYSWQRHTDQLESILRELVTGKRNAIVSSSTNRI